MCQQQNIINRLAAENAMHWKRRIMHPGVHINIQIQGSQFLQDQWAWFKHVSGLFMLNPS
jgi:hypothetical protein